MAQIEVQTARLILRAAKEDDLDAFWQWFRDPEAMNFWSTAPHGSIERTADFLDEMMASSYNGILDFAVCLRPREVSHPDSSGSNGKRAVAAPGPIVIGKAGLYDGKEIGFIFNRAYWGKGYAFEALDAILRLYWSMHADAVAVKADVDPRNESSLRLLKKLGFVVVGSAENTWKTHLGWCDSVYLEAKKPLVG